MKAIPLSLFGRDHWSLLAYAECRCVDDRGVPNSDHLRCNPAGHPGFPYHGEWKTDYSTRLRGHTKERPKMRRGHDDWDCADDLAAAGLFDIKGIGIHPVWSLTKLGQSVAAALRQHKASGGTFATFAP